MAGLLGSLLAAPAGARHQEQAELSQVQDELDAIAKVLADARADANQVARASSRQTVTSPPPARR